MTSVGHVHRNKSRRGPHSLIKTFLEIRDKTLEHINKTIWKNQYSRKNKTLEKRGGGCGTKVKNKEKPKIKITKLNLRNEGVERPAAQPCCHASDKCGFQYLILVCANHIFTSNPKIFYAHRSRVNELFLESVCFMCIYQACLSLRLNKTVILRP